MSPDSTESSTLPSQRQLLTELITSISKVTLPVPDPPAQNPHESGPPQPPPTTPNPLLLIPPAHRGLLTTLHVIYPSLLLPALDLLDRRLVTRVVLDPRLGSTDESAGPGGPAAEAAAAAAAAAFFVVQPAPPRDARRRGRPGAAAATAPSLGGGGGTYAVHLSAWNCTCATFAFAAYAGGGGGLGEKEGEGGGEEGKEGGKASLEEGGWRFGGLSLGSEVPCCKHILACVLSERWAEVLGGYVQVRTVGREEFAGLAAEI
jgi:hypothetical protein